MERNNFIQRTNDSFARLAEWVLDHRLVVIVTCLVLGMGGAALATKIQVNLSQRILAPEDDHDFEYYLDFTEEYGSDEFLYILYSAGQDVFDLDTLRKTRKLVEDLKDVPYVEKVHSVTNIEILESTENDALKISSLMSEFPISQVEANRLREKLLDRPVYVDTYLTKDADYAAILCEFGRRPDEDASYQRKIGVALKDILAKQEYRDFNFYPVGNPLLVSAVHDLLDENVLRINLLSSVLILGFLVLLFRQAKGVMGPYIVVAFALLFVLGFMAINDLPRTFFFPVIPAVLLSIGIADAVHIISEYQIQLKAGQDNRASIVEAVRLLGFPCLFTSITTAIGFSTLTVSSVKGIHDFALATAVGVLAALAFSFTILLVFLSLAGKKSEGKYEDTDRIKKQGIMDKALQRIACFNCRYYKKILISSVIISIFLVYGITRVEVNTSWLMVFGDKIKEFHDFSFADKIMGGTGNYEILMDSKRPDGIKTVKFLETLEKIQNFADSRDYLVKKTISVADMIKEVNRTLHNNDRAFYRIPASDEEVSQYLLLYEISGGEALEKIVSGDISTARITIYVKSTDSTTYKQFYEELVAFIDGVTPDEYAYTITGVSYLTGKYFLLWASTLANSLMLALILICLMMILVFRSLKIGVLSMIPNMFPVVFALGFMGLSGIWLSHVTSMIGCIAIGLAVDDTIHFISRYRMEFDRLGNYEKALEATMLGVGRALTMTTIILIAGFGSAMVSRADMYYYFGLISSICFAAALLADFFIAPALILRFQPFGKEFSPGKGRSVNSML